VTDPPATDTRVEEPARPAQPAPARRPTPRSRLVPIAAADGRPAVSVRGVSKVYGGGNHAVAALDRVHLDVAPGELVCVVGASGCGKSTLLNLMAELDEPTAGEVEVHGRTSLMFQDSALFPWLTVSGNVGLPLRLAKVPKAERRDRVRSLLETVRLEQFADKRPHELSGGMRQRVALARAFAQDAEVLLMDEPFGALDAMTRDVLHDELERLYDERDLTIVFVTHNVREAARLADRIVVMSSRPGRVTSTVDVPLDRPRVIESRAVSEIALRITDLLRKEVRRHAVQDH
jgi:NitT/TauT family transport system ATP-binding protein